MVTMPVPASIVRLPRITSLVIRLWPLVVAKALPVAIIGPVAMDTAAKDQGDEQHTQSSHHFFHYENSCHWFDMTSR
jgi:hypothetical protein